MRIIYYHRVVRVGFHYLNSALHAVRRAQSRSNFFKAHARRDTAARRRQRVINREFTRDCKTDMLLLSFIAQRKFNAAHSVFDFRRAYSVRTVYAVANRLTAASRKHFFIRIVIAVKNAYFAHTEKNCLCRNIILHCLVEVKMILRYVRVCADVKLARRNAFKRKRM